MEVRGAGGVVSRKFFSLTGVGVVLKRSPSSVFAYASSLTENKPIRGARVILYDMTAVKKKKGDDYEPPNQVEELPVNIVAKGETDERGIFQHPVSSSAEVAALVIGPDGSYAICNAGSPQAFEREKTKYFIYTDRPVYRAGDTVYFKIIAKTRDHRFLPLARRQVSMRILNFEMDQTIDERAVTLDEWGTAAGSLALPRDVNLGMYEIQAGPQLDNLYAKGTFYVEQYRKPEFMIEITPSKDYFINGDTAEFKVEAKYFFGAPLQNALVRYRFYENRLRDEAATYWWEESYGDASSYNRIILEGEKYADQHGIAVLRLHAGNYPYDREIICEATVVDRSNVSITESNRVRVGRGEFYIKIEPKQEFFESNQAKQVTVRTLTHTGKPIAARLSVELFRYIWKPSARVYVHDAKPIFSQKVSTDSSGTARIDLPKHIAGQGEYDLVVTGVDRRENVITASRVLWIYDPAGGSIASRFKNLEIAINTATLDQAGDVTCLVKSRFTDAYVCLTLEGRDVYEAKVVPMNGNVTAVTFNIKPHHAPNCYVTATMQRKRALYTATAMVSMPIKDIDLNIAVETDRPKYRPGEKVNLLLKAADEAGRPVRADLSVAAVDESIFQIRRDHTPPIKDFFYAKISNWVLTSYSFPISLLAGAAKDGKIKVREKFEDTAFWSASVRTGADGVARVSFTLPDNLTTWRLTSRGHDREGRVGEKRKTFLVTQDLVARIGAPRFMIEGDELRVMGIVTSNAERGMPRVEERFFVDGKVVTPDEPAILSLPGFGTARKYYPMIVPAGAREVALQYTAEADRDASDSLKIKVPVERRGVTYKLYGIGDMSANRIVTITPPGDAGEFTFIPESMRITVSPSPVAKMIRAATFLTDYPYGCIEQTINRFVPHLALQRVLRHKAYAGLVDEKAKKDLGDRVASGVARLVQQQNEDGTWGWFAGGRGNAFLTAFVLEALHMARNEGYQVNDDCVENGLKALSEVMQKDLEDASATAYCLSVNARWGDWNHQAFERLMKMKERSVFQTAHLLKAVATMLRIIKPDSEEASKLRAAAAKLKEEIINRAKKDSRGLYWESRSEDRSGWPGGDVEVTAHVLSALVAAGDRSTLPAQIVRSLSARSRGDAWQSTKETSTVILAMCEYIEAAGIAPVEKGSISFALDGKRIAEIAFDGDALKKADTLSRTVPLDAAPRTSFIVTAEGSAGPDISFDVTVSGVISFKAKGLASAEHVSERSLKALANGIRVARSFWAVQRVRDVRNAEYLVPQPLADKKAILVGDEILVKVAFAAQDNFSYLVLEDYLPSGFEVTNMDAYQGYQPFVHRERWDNRMVYFFSEVRKGETYEVAYIMRAEIPGRFLARPSRMECMYEPSIQGWSAPAIISVAKDDREGGAR